MSSRRSAMVIVNPVAGSGYAREIVASFRRRLDLTGVETELVVSSGPDELIRFASRPQTPETVVVVAGGDGTVRHALTALRGRPNPLLILPVGTENLLATQLGLLPDADALWNTFDLGRIAPLDLATVNGRLFATNVGVGFDAEVVRRVARNRRGHITHFDYFWPLWRTFWQYRFPRIRVVADGREMCDEPALVFVGNIPRYAIGLRILREASWDDGLLDLCIMRCSHQGPLLEHAFWTLLNWHVEHHAVIYQKVRRVELDSAERVLLQSDGDPAGELPAVVEVLPAAMRVLVPPAPASGARSAG